MITRWHLILARMTIKSLREAIAFQVMALPTKREKWKVLKLYRINKNKSKACKVSLIKDIINLTI